MKANIKIKISCPVCQRQSARVKRSFFQKLLFSSRAYKCFSCQIRFLLFFQKKLTFVYSVKYHRRGDPILTDFNKNYYGLLKPKNVLSTYKLRYHPDK